MSNFVLEARNVVAGYVPDLPILHGVSVHVSAGEIVTIIGPNGAGKSTLIKAVAGLLNVSGGEVLLDGKDITNIPAHKLAAEGVGYVPQTGNVFATLSIHENLVMGGAPLPKERAAERIEEIYALYPILKERMREKAGVLSGGQRQILAVARALLTQPRLILLDEPTAGLSPMAANELFALIRDLVTNGATVLMVEQNAKAALRISDRGYVLAEGQNRIDGAAQALLEDEEIGEIFLGMRRNSDEANQEKETT
jgi:branched-chain amino acid transport system ATP-binding protein